MTKKPRRLPPSPERSLQMSLVRGKGNRSTETAFLLMLRANRLSGWRRHVKLHGRPDFYFAKEKVAVFIDGCFWHGCPKCGRLPKSNIEFWQTKIEQNSARDRKVNRALRGEGVRVLRVWEHALKNDTAVIARLTKALQKAKR